MSNLAEGRIGRQGWRKLVCILIVALAGLWKLVCILIVVSAGGWFVWCFFLSPFLDSQRAVKNHYLRVNVQMTEVAAEAFARKTGHFPNNTEEMKQLFPGGLGCKEGAPFNQTILPPGSPPVNPITWKPEWPSTMTFETMEQVRREAVRIPCAKGSIVYVHIQHPDGYAVVVRDSCGTLEGWGPELTRLP